MTTTEQIKQLRDQTGISIMQCKKALEEAGDDMEKAVILLRKKGAGAAAKKSGRVLGSGVVAAYIHGEGSVGAMVELACETDFVSRNSEFRSLAYDVAMQVAAMNPIYLKPEDISEEDKNRAKEVFAEEVKNKPENMREKILEGKLAAHFREQVLLEQAFIKDQDKKILDIIEAAVHKFGEKVEVIRFSRFEVGKL
ncbi:MAG: elongation factor Ts [bacterium]|nr:elongation factor Ts [bacterium]